MFQLNKNIIKSIYILLFSSLYFSVSAQQTEPSTNDIISDTSQVYNLLKFAEKISKTDLDTALFFFKKAEIASVKIGDKKVLMHCYFAQANVLFNFGINRKALILFQKTLLLANELQSEFHISSSKVYIGTIYMLMADYNLALEYNLEGLAYFEKEKDYNVASGIYLNLTFIQIEQNDTAKAREYAGLALKYSKQVGNKIYESKSLLNYGELFFLNGDYEKSLFYYYESLKISEDNNFNSFIPTIHLNMGSTFLKMNKPDSTEFHLNYVIANELNPYFKSLGYLSFSELYEYKKEYEKAIDFAEKADKLGASAKLDEIRNKANKFLAQLYAKKGNFKKAYEYKLISDEINDSVFSEEKYRIQNELETVYENSKKKIKIDELSTEKEINELENERSKFIIVILILILFGFLFLGLLLLRQNKLKAKHESIELEQKLLRLQMNPHFIFNSISSIQDFILDNNPLEASSYLSDFAKLMRATLTNSSDNFILLSKEIETTEHYLKLQHLRLSDKFKYEIVISDEINKDQYSVPPMLMQPFIENSIIHGIMKKTVGKGLITVSYTLNNGNLILETRDNGIGRKSSKKYNNSNHKSRALDITNQRITLLSKKYKQNVIFEILDLNDENNNSTGTLVRFILPILEII